MIGSACEGKGDFEGGGGARVRIGGVQTFMRNLITAFKHSNLC